MPTKKKSTKKISRSTKVQRKPKKQHPKHFLKVYWPYIPVLIITSFGLLFGSILPLLQKNQPATLAYATEMSVSNLLSGTNAQRTSRGIPALTINSKLNSSASAKAADMRDRDYWAHNTPDGNEPWIFFDAAGYNYQKAGENLAYGFSSSAETITGWMNSPSHRDNMLDTEYTEVGFGFVNSTDFVNTGQETIIVAHYGKPVKAPAPAPKPVASPTTPQALPSSNSSPTQPTPEPEPKPEIVEELVKEPQSESVPIENSRVNQPVTSDSPIPVNRPSQNISRLQILTDGNAPWSAIVLSIAALSIVIVWIIKHAVLVKRFVLYGEHFVAHHPILDLTVVTVAAIAVYLTQSSGVVL
jgi:hypothetical protein